MWFEHFPFTSYSEADLDILCLPCALFPMFSENSRGRWAHMQFSKPLTNWKDAEEDLLSHSALYYHVKSSTKPEEFVRVYKQTAGWINNDLATKAQATIKHNHAIFASIAKCLELCACDEHSQLRTARHGDLLHSRLWGKGKTDCPCWVRKAFKAWRIFLRNSSLRDEGPSFAIAEEKRKKNPPTSLEKNLYTALRAFVRHWPQLV